MALVRRSVTAVTELMKVIENQRRITISPRCITTRHVRSLDHYSSALLYSCLYSALDTLPCALLVLYRLYPRRATPPGARHLPPFRFSPSQSGNRFPARERDGRRRGAQTTFAQTCDAKGKEEPGGGGRRAMWNFFSSRISIYNRIYNHHGCYILVLDHSLDSSLFLRNWLRNSPSKFLVSESSVCRPASCDVPHEKNGAFCMHRQFLESFPEKLNGR